MFDRCYLCFTYFTKRQYVLEFFPKVKIMLHAGCYHNFASVMCILSFPSFLFDVRLKNDIGTGLVCCRGQVNILAVYISNGHCCLQCVVL